MDTRIHLDNHTLTRPLRSVVEKMLPFFREPWLKSDKADEQILRALGAEENAFHFFSSGAEAIYQVLYSYTRDFLPETGQNHILSTVIEEPCFLESLMRLEKEGLKVKLLPVNAQGQITKEMLAEAIRPRTGLVSLSWANRLTGVIHPIADLAEACKEKGIVLHVDASCVLGKLYFRLEDLPIDFVTFEGSLIHAPSGTGGLVAQRKQLTPVIAGQSDRNDAGMAAVAQALDEGIRGCDHLCLETARLRNKLEEGIQQALPDAVVFFHQVDRLPNCTAIGFPGVIGEALLYLLHRKGIYATCQNLAPVLIASGIDPLLAESAVSFSLSYETSDREIDKAITEIVSCVERLRSYSKELI